MSARSHSSALRLYIQEENQMNKTASLPKPIQAGDYGKIIPKTPKNNNENGKADTDGRKTLALWTQ